MATLTGAVWLLARLSLVAMFPFSAVDKIWHWNNSLAQTKSDGLPGGAIMLVLAILVEGLTPFCILFGWMDRPAAVLLAGFCVVTAFLYHPFWAIPGLLQRQRGQQGARPLLAVLEELRAGRRTHPGRRLRNAERADEPA